MKKLSTHIREHLGAYLLATFSLVTCTSLDMLSPQLTKSIIDDVIGKGEINKLTYLLLGILGIGIARFIFGYIKEFVFDRTGARIAANMRSDLFKHVQKLSPEFFDRTGTGELMSRVKDDIDRIWDGITYVGMLVIEVVIHVSMVLFCMYRLNWKLALLPTVCMIFCGFLAVYLEKKLDKVYEDISDENAKLNTVAEENLGGVRTVKAFAREKFEIKKFLSHNNRYYELNMQQSKVFVKYHPLFSAITKLLPLVVLLVGGYFVIYEDFSLGSLGAFVEYSNNIVWPMEMVGWLANSVSSAFSSNKKIKKIYSEIPDIKEKENPVVLPEVKGKVTFEGVGFKRGDRQILSDISFSVDAGTTLGIMGATGSGKSSITHLLMRLYDSQEGKIKLDDVDIKDLTLKQLRGSISPVTQDVFLFSDTISENVSLGQKDVLTKDVMMQACEDAQASSFIEKLSDGYDTVIGERGVGLSGGQKQRISIARALSKKTPVLILDDSTSALDMETEHAIWQTLNKMEGITKLIIAHRISAVRHANQIIYLEDGRIAEQGTHEELLAKKGLYYETYMAQYGEFLTESEV
ncbi:MAG: ABC transporter ATP-binding protein [Lachnospiraceae bacterium]|nr:ABC transporter ATP-binding protein [Lachnospiraceae bacterium]MBQ9123142.1 ABC transporter ATP-binding protein [Lachnospiraceae bacterium]